MHVYIRKCFLKHTPIRVTVHGLFETPTALTHDVVKTAFMLYGSIGAKLHFLINKDSQMETEKQTDAQTGRIGEKHNRHTERIRKRGGEEREERNTEQEREGEMEGRVERTRRR